MTLTKNFLMGMAVAVPLVTAVGAIAPVHAAPLGSYTFSSGSTSATGVDPNISFSQFTRSADVIADSFVGVFASAGWTSSSSRDDGDFLSFTVTPTSGYQLSLQSLKLDLYRLGTGLFNAGSGAPRNWELGVKVGSNPIGIFTSGTLTGFDEILTVNTREGVNALNISLVSLGSVTSPVQFFLYGFRSSNQAGILYADNVVLDGSVNAVPTPALLPAMLGFGAGVLRKRKSAKLAKAEV